MPQRRPPGDRDGTEFEKAVSGTVPLEDRDKVRPPPKTLRRRRRRGDTEGVQFESGKSELKTVSYPLLDEAGEVLSRWPQLTIEIGGHTDSRGKAKANAILSERRAQAVADYLLWRFPQVSSNQIRVRGYGEEQPVASNKTKEGRQKNRRVEFIVLNREELRQIRK